MTVAKHSDTGVERHYGVYPAIVTDISDPKGLGRVQVKFPWLGNSAGGADVRAWATLSTPYAGDDQGFLVYPEVDTQVLVVFEAGDLRRPYAIGACWNGREAVPQAARASNDIRVWKTRSGSKLEFDDTAQASKITLTLANQNSVVIDEASDSLTIRHHNGCVIRLSVNGQIEIQATATVEVTAPALNVHAATATFDGIVTCESLVANVAVASPLYTQGAGNFW